MAYGTSRGPVVSVLMAVHDAEGYVRRAVESIQNQSLRELELIVVDAGSQDSTARVVEAMAERDLRIELVRADACSRQEALDVALERATGRYLSVVDADGFARPTMLADLVGRAEDRALELVIGGVDLCLLGADGRASEVELAADETTFPTQHDFRSAAWRLFASGQLLPATGKLFSLGRARELGLRFGSDLPSDHLFVLGYLQDVERVGVIGGTCCHIDRRTAPAMRRFERPEGGRALDREHAALLSLYRHWGLEGDAASMEMLQSRYMERLVACVEGVCGSGLPPAEQKAAVGRLIGADQARLAASLARPASNAARSMLAPVRSRNVGLVCAQARLLSLLGRGRTVWAMPDAFI